MCLKMAQPYMCKMHKTAPSTPFSLKVLLLGKDLVIETLIKRAQ